MDLATHGKLAKLANEWTKITLRELEGLDVFYDGDDYNTDLECANCGKLLYTRRCKTHESGGYICDGCGAINPTIHQATVNSVTEIVLENLKQAMYEFALEDDMKRMSVRQLAEHVQEADPKPDKYEVTDRLGTILCDVGMLWDEVMGTDASKGKPKPYGGTPNTRSMTYKLRKLAGYSYP